MEVARTSSADPASAEEAFARFFPGASIGADREHGFRFDLRAHRASSLTLLEYRLSGPTIRATATSSGFIVCDVRLVGEMTHRREPIDTARPFVYPDVLTATRERSVSRLVDIDPVALRRFAARQVGDERFRLRMEGFAPVSAERARAWRSVARAAAGRVRDGAADAPLIGAAVGDLVMAAFLSAFPTNALERPDRDAPGAGASAAVRRARAFIDEHHAEPIGLTDVAAAGRISTRGLHAAFRRAGEDTPMAYLRRVRLEDARRTLLQADPGDGVTVAAVARSAGFAHASRFAAAYHDEYGEAPGDTLRR